MTNKTRFGLDRLKEATQRYIDRKAQALNQELMILDEIAETLFRLEDQLERLEDQHRKIISPNMTTVLEPPQTYRERRCK